MKLTHTSTNKLIGISLQDADLVSSQTYPNRKHFRQFKMQKKKNGTVENILNQVYSNYSLYSYPDKEAVF
jgi:hypothetical protein